MSDMDDIDQALSDAERNLDWLSRKVIGIDASDSIRASRRTLADGRRAFDRIRQKLREGRMHIEAPPDFKRTSCGCSDPGMMPPCSWCTDPENNPDRED